MRLVPRQLQIHGMTGDVPYFGGRLTPAQAYAASHPRPVATGATPGTGSPEGVVAVGGPWRVVPPGTYPPAASPDRGPIPGIPSAVPQAAPLRVPSTLQPTQAPSVLAPATAQPVAPGAVPGGPLVTQIPPLGPKQPPGPAAGPAGGPPTPESQRAIQQLLLAGVITTSEADQLAGRLPA